MARDRALNVNAITAGVEFNTSRTVRRERASNATSRGSHVVEPLLGVLIPWATNKKSGTRPDFLFGVPTGYRINPAYRMGVRSRLTAAMGPGVLIPFVMPPQTD